MSFGKMPIANGFLTEKEFQNEYFFELKTAVCPECHMFQLVDQPEDTQLFHDHYAYFASASSTMREHFRLLAERVMADELKGDNPFVVEVGSNDGIMLRNFMKAGVRHLGVEPSANVAQAAIDEGMNVKVSYFNKETAEEIIAEQGKADAILGGNVIGHIPYFHSVASGIKTLLKDDGVFIFENAYLGSVISRGSYDQIYDEHVFTFSCLSVQNAFARHGMELVDAEQLEVHGGSMRYTVTHKGARPVSGRLTKQIAWEKELGLDGHEVYQKFRENCERLGSDFLTLLQKLKSEGKRVAGYGAAAKSTTILNYSNVTSDLIEFIQDTTPTKQGKFSPGIHIPITDRSRFVESYPDYTVLFAWNLAEEIMTKEKDYSAQGGKWILLNPDVRIVEGI